MKITHPRDLPRVDDLAATEALGGFAASIRVSAAREAIDRARRSLLDGGGPLEAMDIVIEAVERARVETLPSQRRVINLTGVILHTGLGRAPLAESVLRAIGSELAGASNLEFDLESGQRGDRQEHARTLLRQLTGAEDALVVNNAAAATVLSLAALGRGGEVVLSRGQMVEIGGSFRLPDIIEASGCRLVEVGCTNKTRIADYEGAIGAETRVLLRCHPSNYRLIGFTDEPSLEEMVGLARAKGVEVIDDQGSGLLFDGRADGLPHTPVVPDAIRAGAALVLASTDKLLGGPQGGMLVGSADAVGRCRRHPLARAFRIDKVGLVALEATLKLHAQGRLTEIPTWRAIRRDPAEVRRDAQRLARAFAGPAEVRQCRTEFGSGCAPGDGIPSFAAVLLAPNPEALARWLRERPTPIIGRIEKGAVWLDPRASSPSDLRTAGSELKGWR